MRRFLRLPSPAMTVAFIAVVLALTGSATALVGTSTVFKDDIATNAVGKSEIRSNAVGRSEARTNGIGKSELRANSVGISELIENQVEFGGMSARRIAPFTLTNGQSLPVATIGPFELTAACTINQANTDRARVDITTNQNNSALDGDDEDADFDTGETQQFADRSVAPTGTPSFEQENDGVAIAPDGTEILGQEFYVGVNVLNQAGRCRFGGTLYVG